MASELYAAITPAPATPSLLAGSRHSYSATYAMPVAPEVMPAARLAFAAATI